MKPAYRLSVRAATLLMVLVVLAATAVIVVSTRISAQQHDEARTRADRAITNSSLYETAISGVYNEWVTVVSLFTLGDPAYVEQFDASRAEVEASLLELRRDALVHDPAGVATLDEFIATHARFADVDEDIIQSILANDLNSALALAVESGITVDSDRLLKDLRLEVDDQRNELRAAQAQQAAAESSTLRWSLGTGAMCAVLLLAIALAAHQWVGAPLRRASAATRAIAAGDISAKVPVGGPRELADLGDDVNRMAGALIRRSAELNAYLEKDLETRTAELERANTDLAREVDERRRAEETLARSLEAEKELEAQLRDQAFHDPLTRLANRARFMDRLEHALLRAAGSGQKLAILFMDLDDFKAVNDSLGHPAGDRLLVDVAARLAGNLRPGDTAARFGGDEFAVLLEDARDMRDATAVSARIIESLRAPFLLSDTEVFVRASIGIAAGNARETPDELLRRADVAMYAAKADGKGRATAYEPAMDESIVGRLELAAELQRAIERNEFVVYYQPSIVLETGRVAGVEALLRWRHPIRGLLLPADFVPVAEATGLILPIGRWVLREACFAARRWQQDFPLDPPLSVAVNVSARQVHQPGLLDVVAEALRDSGLPKETLILEITENLMMEDADLAIERLNQLKQLGVRIAIDDFGTGYSSLSYLRRFPVDILKIDKSFVDGVSRRGKERELAESIIELGHSLSLEIVAEGVEHAEQLGWLKTHRCAFGQGFYFSEPVDPSVVDDILRRNDAARPAA